MLVVLVVLEPWPTKGNIQVLGRVQFHWGCRRWTGFVRRAIWEECVCGSRERSLIQVRFSLSQVLGQQIVFGWVGVKVGDPPPPLYTKPDAGIFPCHLSYGVPLAR